MNKGIPVAVEQIIDAVRDKNTPSHVKQNHITTLERIKKYCDITINDFYKKR